MLNIPIKDHFRETRIFNSRLIVVVAGALGLVLLLSFRLAYLQIFSHRHYETLSQSNRVRPLPLPAPRGLVLDRHGAVLAQNFPVVSLDITPVQVKNMNALLEELAQHVRLTEGDLKAFRKLVRERPRFEPIALRANLTDEEAARIAVRLPNLTGVELQGRLQRHYPLGGLGVHAVGYVGRISEEDMKIIDKSAYRGMRHIGRLGLEATYEENLLGTVGFEKIETTAHGRRVNTIERIAPQAGQNLYLSLDVKLQALIEQALGKRRGAVVAMDPKTGAVLAFVSTPTYDPNPFVNGIDTAAYKALLDDPDKPLINRVLNGQYSPGSTIKTFLGLAALELDNFDANKAIHCGGSFNFPGRSHLFRDWKKTGHGAVTLHDAIVQSCDVYFYRLAVQMEIDAMKNFLAPFGFGARTGVDLPRESEGILPSPAWKEERGQKWYPGETVVTGIGQGLILATPLQLASATAAIANQGVRVKPHLGFAFEHPKEKTRSEFSTERINELPMKDKAHLATLVEHLTAVAHSPRGTAYGIGYNAPYKIAGKTGTAQVKSIAQGQSYVESLTPERFRDHALFVSFAPADNPQVAVAVIVENGGHGASAAAPIARKVMDYLILGKVEEIKGVKVEHNE
jgi:penicillin-binding protein 2